MNKMLPAIAVLIAVSTLAAEPSGPAAVRIPVPKLEKAPVLDGRIDDLWKNQATRVSNFSLVKTGGPAAGQTEVYLGYDRLHLYVGMVMFVSSEYVPVVSTPASARDQAIWNEDSVELFFAPQSKEKYVQFIVNRLGALFDARDGSVSWNGVWSAKTSVFPDRWEVEAAIPLATIGVEPDEGICFPFQVARNQRIPSESSSLAPVSAMFWEGVKTAVLVLGGTTAVQMDSAPFLKPIALSGRLLGDGPEATVRVQLTGAQGKDMAAVEGKIPSGVFSLNLPDLPFGGPYRADVSFTRGQEHYRFLVPFEINLPLKVVVQPNILKDRVEFSLTYFGPEPPERYVFRFCAPDRTAPVKTGETANTRRYSVSWPFSEFPVGKYTVAVDCYRGGSLIDTRRTDFEVPSRPEWIDFKSGVTDEVLAPWTPLMVKGNSVTCWGREYRFRGLFPDRILSQGQALLAAPVALEITVRGRVLKIETSRAEFVETTSHRVVYRAEGNAGKMTVTATTTVEYDGLMKTDLQITPVSGAVLSSLRLKIPLRKEYVRLRTQSVIWGATLEEYKELLADHREGGSIEETVWKNKAEPLWLGSETCGLGWVVESGRGYRLVSPDDALEIKAGQDETLLTVTFINRPGSLTDSLNYTFALLATPVKPWREDAYRGWNTVIAPSDIWYPGVTNYVYDPAEMDWLQKQRVRAIVDMSDWTRIHDSLLNCKPDWLRAWVGECHRRGIKALAYFGHGITTGTPEWRIMGEEVLRSPRSSPFSLPNTPGLLSYRACARSAYADHIAWKIDWVMREFHIDGVYLDEYGPELCLNALHGCGYEEHGIRKGERPIFSFREEMKRIYSVVKKNNPDGIVYLHGRSELPALSFCDLYLTGEQFIPVKRETRPALLKMLPLGAFRADFTGRPFGVPGTLYVYHNLPWGRRDAVALSVLHNTPPVQSALYGRERKEYLEDLSSVWKVLDEFGAHCAEFVGYWEQDTVVPESRDVKASIWKRSDGARLVFAANFGPAGETALSLKISGYLACLDALTKQELSVENGKVHVTMDSEDFRMFTITGGTP